MISIGTDIVYIPRIHDLIDLKGTKFLNKIFTDDEIHYCNEQANPSIHFSGKYAAKEAVKNRFRSIPKKLKRDQRINLKNLLRVN